MESPDVWLDVWNVKFDDIYDFIRCPRILGFKLLGVKLEKWRPESNKSIELPTTLKGQIGEKAFEKALMLKDAVESYGIENIIAEKVMESLNPSLISEAKDYVNDIVQSAVRGALNTKNLLELEYGKPQIIAKAKVINTLLQISNKPDYIIGFPRNKYIIVDVKNTKRTEGRHKLKVAFYVEASRLAGASILMERIVDDHIELIPVDTSQINEGVVIYTRLSKIEKAYPLKLTEEIVSDVMKTKYVVSKGSLPSEANMSYCSKCRYKGICASTPKEKFVDLDSISMPIPLTIIAALELNEKYDMDLDYLFKGSYFLELYRKVSKGLNNKRLGDIQMTHRRIEYDPYKLLEELTGEPRDEIRTALDYYEMYRKLIREIVIDDRRLPTTQSYVLNLIQNKDHALRLLKTSLIQVHYTCSYPSNSVNRVKEAYYKLHKLLQ